MEVDHLIPVSAAQNSLFIRILLNICGITNINEEKNLVSACRKCNRKKSDKIGLWVIRGAFGRYRIIWILRDIIILLTLLSLGYLIWQQYIETGLLFDFIEALK